MVQRSTDCGKTWEPFEADTLADALLHCLSLPQVMHACMGQDDKYVTVYLNSGHAWQLRVPPTFRQFKFTFLAGTDGPGAVNAYDIDEAVELFFDTVLDAVDCHATIDMADGRRALVFSNEVVIVEEIE